MHFILAKKTCISPVEQWHSSPWLSHSYFSLVSIVYAPYTFIIHLFVYIIVLIGRSVKHVNPVVSRVRGFVKILYDIHYLCINITKPYVPRVHGVLRVFDVRYIVQIKCIKSMSHRLTIYALCAVIIICKL